MKHIPRKRFGQHFLVDDAIIDGIVRAVQPRPGDKLLEIGPGLGAITQPLLERSGALTVIEIDRDLIAHWSRRSGVRVIASDVLRVDFAELHHAWPSSEQHPAQGHLRIVGNLPYNISTPILFHLLPVAHWVQDQHFMLQKEVIDRMVAEPATAAYGRLSVMLQWRYEMENFLDVPPAAFDPPPRVDSAVVRMLPRPQPAAVDVPLLEALVQVAFSQRRKILRNTLGRWLEARQFTGEFDLQRRAEEVPPEEYIALAQKIDGAVQ